MSKALAPTCCDTASSLATKPRQKQLPARPLLTEFSLDCRCRDVLPVIPSGVEGSRGESEKLAMRRHNYFVYILTNQRHTVLYMGITNDLGRRRWERGVSRRSH